MRGTTRFNIRIDKASKGLSPIELIYSTSGKRKYMATGQSILAIYWDPASQTAVFKSIKQVKAELKDQFNDRLTLTEPEIKSFNYQLETLRVNIEKLEQNYIRLNKPFSSEMIITELKGLKNNVFKKEEPTNYVFDFIDQYIQDNAATRVKGSLSVYKSLSSHLKAYEQEKRKKVTFEGIDYKFFSSFQNFLLARTKTSKAGKVTPLLNNTSIAKSLSTLKTFLGYAKLHGVKLNESFRDFKIKRESMEVIALTQGEFEALYNLDLSGDKKLSQVRDVFCFSCVTGLRYSDLSQLRREHIKPLEIQLTITKTKELLRIPLTQYSYDILEKYKKNHKPLPVISSQKFNDYIKELAEKAGINEEVEIVRFRGSVREANVYPKYELLSAHTGRKTFVTLSLERGMSAEEVMTVSGHTDYKSFKRYVKITEERKKVVMTLAWGEPSKNLRIAD